MAELLKVLVSPWNFLWVVVVFGFAPGFCLRLIVRVYPRNNPRRRELIAELYAIPYIKRPLWVAQQLETALFEGLGYRISVMIRLLARGHLVMLWPVKMILRFVTGSPIGGYKYHKTDATWSKPGTRYVPPHERKPRHWWEA